MLGAFRETPRRPGAGTGGIAPMQSKRHRASRHPLITREHRDTLYAAALFNLEATAGDVALAVGKGDVEDALRLRRRIATAFACWTISAGIGWTGARVTSSRCPLSGWRTSRAGTRRAPNASFASSPPRSLDGSMPPRTIGITRTPRKTIDPSLTRIWTSGPRASRLLEQIMELVRVPPPGLMAGLPRRPR
jgi:hypothetical protein